MKSTKWKMENEKSFDYAAKTAASLRMTLLI